MPTKMLYLDVETTGLDPKLHEITQIAYIIEVDREIVLERSLFMRPLRVDTIDDKALEIQGCTRGELATFQHPFTAYRQMVADLNEHIDRYDKADKARPVAYNANFDLDFLKSWFECCSDKFLGSYVNWRTLDPLALVRWFEAAGLIPAMSDHKLGTMAAYFRIETEKAHCAMSDVRAMRDLTRVLLDCLMQAGRP